MRLFDYQHLFEYPMSEIRRLLVAAAGHSWSSWRVDLVTATLGIQVDEASKLMETLLEEGFVALDAPGDDSCYELTIKGRGLAMARAKLIRRTTAERLVSEFLQRVEEVNDDPNLLYWVDEVVVFGSFLTESETLGDVDLAVMYTRRTDDPKDFGEREKARVREARAAGRHFPSFFDKLIWPLREIELRLRKRSGSLSLHDLGRERTFIEALPHRQIYLRRTGTLTSSPDLTSVLPT
jgi:predicted nucleotidyltransferase